jgi:hypothetical protein
MTKLEALLKGIKVWSYLAVNTPTSADAYNTKRIAYETLGLEDDENFCAMCDYSFPFARGRMHLVSSCANCPVWSEHSTCEADGSPYDLWSESVRHHEWGKSCEHAEGVLQLILKAKQEYEETMYES